MLTGSASPSPLSLRAVDEGLHLLNAELVSQPTQCCKLFSSPTQPFSAAEGMVLISDYICPHHIVLLKTSI